MKQGVWLVQPLKGMGCYILYSVKMTLNARLYLYQCIANFVFLEVARGGTLPLNSITAAALSYNVTANVYTGTMLMCVHAVMTKC